MGYDAYLLTDSREAVTYQRRFTYNFHEQCPADVDGLGHQVISPVRFVLFGGDLPIRDWRIAHDRALIDSCACGYRFDEDDPAQEWIVRLHCEPDGRQVNVRTGVGPRARAGGIWEMPIYGPDYWGADRKSYGVVLPMGATFPIDYPARTQHRGRYFRTGEAPALTVLSEIHYGDRNDHNGYRGWLLNGILSDDLDGRTYKEP